MKAWLSAVLSNANWFLLLLTIHITLKNYFPEIFGINHLGEGAISGFFPLLLTILVIINTKKLKDKDNQINELKHAISDTPTDNNS